MKRLWSESASDPALHRARGRLRRISDRTIPGRVGVKEFSFVLRMRFSERNSNNFQNGILNWATFSRAHHRGISSFHHK